MSINKKASILYGGLIFKTCSKQKGYDTYNKQKFLQLGQYSFGSRLWENTVFGTVIL